MPTRSATPTPALQDPPETPTTPGRSLLTVKEVAQLLNMSERWVHERTRRRDPVLPLRQRAAI